jgi:hypothetical protein
VKITAITSKKMSNRCKPKPPKPPPKHEKPPIKSPPPYDYWSISSYIRVSVASYITYAVEFKFARVNYLIFMSKVNLKFGDNSHTRLAGSIMSTRKKFSPE